MIVGHVMAQKINSKNVPSQVIFQSNAETVLLILEAYNLGAQIEDLYTTGWKENLNSL